MDAETEYYTICANRYLHPLKDGEYGEVHHILPRSLGGMDISQNLVKLTPEEHYRVHELLPFIYIEGKEHKAMVYAWNQMRGRVKGAKIDSEAYGQLKREFSKVRRETKWSDEVKRKIGDGNRGKHRTEAERKHLSEVNTGRTRRGWTVSEEGRRHISDGMKLAYALGNRKARNKGVSCSEETRRKISEAMKRYWAQRKNFGVA